MNEAQGLNSLQHATHPVSKSSLPSSNGLSENKDSSTPTQEKPSFQRLYHLGFRGELQIWMNQSPYCHQHSSAPVHSCITRASVSPSVKWAYQEQPAISSIQNDNEKVVVTRCPAQYQRERWLTSFKDSANILETDGKFQ